MKIIKPGKKEFIGTCSRCGCEFSYTLEELKAQYPLKYVLCPECDKEYYHPDQNICEENLSDYITRKSLEDSKNKNEELIDEIFHRLTFPKDSYTCPKCGHVLVKDTSVVLTTYPPQYRWDCPNCGHSETHYEKGSCGTITTSSGCDAGAYVDLKDVDPEAYERLKVWNRDSDTTFIGD